MCVIIAGVRSVCPKGIWSLLASPSRLYFALRFISHVPNKGGSRVPWRECVLPLWGGNVCIPPIIMFGDLSNGVAAMGTFFWKNGNFDTGQFNNLNWE